MLDFSPFDSRPINVPNDKKDHFIRYRTKGKPLTYLVGAKCRDGIVIASDSRKVSVDNRTNSSSKIETGWKIIQLDENLVIGGAGDTRLFKQFLNELNERLNDAWTYGEMFLKMFWNNSFSMRKTVELVQFILNIIDQHGLDVHVDHRLQYYYIPYKTETQNTDYDELSIIYNNVGKMHDLFNKAIDEINDIRYDDSRKELDEEYKKRHNMVFDGDFEIDNQKKNSKTKPKSKRTIS